MNRRDVLRLTGAAGALAVAGCVSDGDGEGSGNTDDEGDGNEATPTPTPTPDGSDDGSGEDGTDDGGSSDEESGESAEYAFDDPVATVEGFVQAFQNGDVEAYNAIVYEDGSLEPVPEDTNPEDLMDMAPEIEEIELVEVEGDTATVEAQLRVPNEDGPVQATVELTKVDGTWRIGDITDQSSSSPTPNTAFSFDTDDGSMTITLDAGDAIPADELFVRGEGVGTSGVWHELDDDIAADELVQAGDSVTVDVEDEYSINIVWESGNESATLSSIAGASESESVGEVDSYLSDVGNYDGTVEDFTGEAEVTVEAGELEDTEQIYAFDPPAIRIEPGTTVTWEWVGDVAHSVTHEEETFDSGVRSGEGTTFSFAFEETGTYLYYCRPHRGLGMKGAVVVEG